MEDIKIVDYDKKTKAMIVLSGRDLGYQLRNKMKLDQKDSDGKKYKVHFPKNIISISTSFFLALFGESVRKCGDKEVFLNKYSFECSDNMMININDGIIDALNNVDGLS